MLGEIPTLVEDPIATVEDSIAIVEVEIAAEVVVVVVVELASSVMKKATLQESVQTVTVAQ